MANWQSDSNQQAGGWYSGSSGGWASNDASGYDIPIDDEEDQQQAALNPYFDVSEKPAQRAPAFGSREPPSFRQPSPPTYAAPFPNQFNDANRGGFTDQMNLWGGATNNSASGGRLDEDDRPLMEELGINFDHIRQKTLAVLNPLMTADKSVLNDNDLSGPLVFCLVFGFSLLLHGKVHFGYVYGIGLLGCSATYALLNLMSASGISLTCAVSVLGYCLLPMSLLSLVAAVFSFKGIVGLSVAIAAVFWCSFSSSKLFVTALTMDKQRILVAYPCSLFYGLFALMAIY